MNKHGIIALTLAASLAGCGNHEGAGADADKSLDACQIVTADEAQALVGKPVTSTGGGGGVVLIGGDQGNASGGSTCGWIPEGKSVSQLNVTVWQGDLPGERQDVKVLHVDGIGDDALAMVREGSVIALLVRKSDHVLKLNTVFLDVPPEGPKFEQLKRIATAAAGRM